MHVQTRRISRRRCGQQARPSTSNVNNMIDLTWRNFLYRLCGKVSEGKKVKVSHAYSITERRVPELISVLGSQPAGDVNHKSDGRLPLLSAKPAVTLAVLKSLLPILLLGEQRHNGCELFA